MVKVFVKEGFITGTWQENRSSLRSSLLSHFIKRKIDIQGHQT